MNYSFTFPKYVVDALQGLSEEDKQEARNAAIFYVNTGWVMPLVNPTAALAFAVLRWQTDSDRAERAAWKRAAAAERQRRYRARKKAEAQSNNSVNNSNVTESVNTCGGEI